MSKISHILPFMEEEELKELAIKIINGEVSGVKLAILYPFLNHESLDEVIDLMIEKNMGKQLYQVLPFADEEKISMILEHVMDGSLTGIKEHMFYPFLKKDKLKEIFNRLVEKSKENPDEKEDEDYEEMEEED
ncbi:MAG TPA: hypothetical protein PKU69_00160 [Bacillota bacterium]|nr:hypothetical protein [Bacillota bacterium]HPJ23627.1 hypothetical protein [Bacillota bacterium]